MVWCYVLWKVPYLMGNSPILRVVGALQMKGYWEFNINVWFPFMYSPKWNCYFQNRSIMFCLPVPTFIYLREIYIFPGSVCLFCCREICVPILGIYKHAHRHMNMEIRTEAAQFPEKEYINGIFLQCVIFNMANHSFFKSVAVSCQTVLGLQSSVQHRNTF